MKQNSQLYNILHKLGLNDIEINIYISNLKLGSTSVQKIAELTNQKRASIYPYIDSLKEKKLIKLSKRKYIAAKPEKLLDLLKLKKEHINNLKTSFPQILKEIKSQYTKDTDEIFVISYPSIEGIKKIYKDTLSSKNPILSWNPDEEEFNKLKSFKDIYINQRIKNNIHIKSILFSNNDIKPFEENNKNDLRRISYLNKNYKFTSHIKIYNDKVAVMHLKNSYTGIVIKNEEFAHTMRVIHQICWDFNNSK